MREVGGEGLVKFKVVIEVGGEKVARGLRAVDISASVEADGVLSRDREVEVASEEAGVKIGVSFNLVDIRIGQLG